MKYILVVTLFFYGSFASAQNVNIPDPALKSNLLNIQTLNLNGDGEIQLSEALSVTTTLDLSYGPANYYDLTGLEAFQNMRTLNISLYYKGTDFSLVSMPNLKILAMGGNWVNMTSINISGLINLEGFYSSQINAGTVDIIFGHLPRLKRFYAQDCWFGTLDFTGCDSLEQIGDYFPFNCRSMNVSGLTQLDTISGVATSMGLIARNCTALKLIKTGTYDMEGPIDVTGCTNLTELNIAITGTTLTSLDFSSCPNFKSLAMGVTDNFHYLNLKNGNYPERLYLPAGTASVLNVCADDFAVDSITNMINNNIYFTGTLNVSPYCSFFPGGATNTIHGNVKIDLNGNGCDIADNGIASVPVRIINSSGSQSVSYTSNTGNYINYGYNGNFTIAPYFPHPYYTWNPVSANIVFDTANNLIDSANFCIRANGSHHDLDITMLPLSRARPGMAAQYQIHYKNKGTTILSGDVKLNFTGNLLTLNTANPSPASQNTGELTWNYSNLPPFETRTIYVYFTLLPPPVNNIGDTLVFVTTISPAVNDETPNDNSFTLPQEIRGSLDPNEKECLQGSKIAIANIGKPLDYIIRFQNLGTDTAFNIVVADTLSNKLDWNTIEITGTSHPCDVRQKDNSLEFYFKNINLPYAAENEPASHGYVAFKIRPNSNVIIGDSLNNRAAIYFDFNLPVITNTATTIVSPTSSVAVKLEYFSLTTKSETNLLTWKAPATSGSTLFGIEKSNDGIHFSNFGNITATADRCQLPFNFTDEKPFDGKTWYRLNIKDADGHSFYSKVLVAGKTKSGVSINAIVSDRNNTTIYLNASKEQNVQMKIIAADGRLLYNQSKTIEAGSSSVNLPLKDVATGIYTLVVYTAEGEVIIKRFVK